MRGSAGGIVALRLHVRPDAEAKGEECDAMGEVEFEASWPSSQQWIQKLREPGQDAVVCLQGYLAMDFEEEDEIYHKRYEEHEP